MNWRKTLLLFVGLPAVVYGIAHGAVWYTVKSRADDVKQALAPFAKFNYGKIHASLFGPVGIGDITISPHSMDDTFRVGSVLAHPDGPADLYRILRASHSAAIPASFKISINRAQFDLTGPLFEMMDQMSSMGAGAATANIGSNFGCGDRQQFGITDLVRMGYDTLVTDLRFEYGLDNRDGTLNLFTRVRTHDMMEFSFEGVIPAEQAGATIRSPGAQIPSLSNLTFSYQDEDYNRRKNQYCSDLTGVSVEKFLDRHVAGFEAFLHSGDFTPSQALIEAYRKFVANPGSRITVSLNPYEPLDMFALQRIDSAEWLEWLGVKVSVNGDPVAELGSVNPRAEEQLAEGDETKPKVTPDTYKLTPLAELGGHLNRKVKILTNDGKQHDAYLERIEPEQLVLTQHLVGGSATFSVPLATIDEVLVLR